MRMEPVTTRGMITPRRAWRPPTQPSRALAVDLKMTGEADVAMRAMDVLKPYFVLACVAFMVGFVSYLGLVRTQFPSAQADDAWQATISAPAAHDAPLVRSRSI